MKRNAIALICMALVALAVFVPAQMAGLLSPARPVSDIFVGQASSSDGQNSQDSQGMQTSKAGVPIGGSNAVSGDTTTHTPLAEPEYVPGEVVVGLSDGATIDQLNVRLAELDYVATKSVSADDVSFGFVKLALARGVDVPDAMERLAGEKVVASAEPNYVLCAMEESDSDSDYAATNLQSGSIPEGSLMAQSTTLNDEYAGKQWALAAVHAHEAWDYMRAENAAAPVTVAVIDSGLNVNHEDFESTRIVGAKNYVKKTENPGDSGDLGGSDAPDDSDVTDENGHGTHVAGIIAATANNGKGIAGVSYNARIMPVRIMDAGGNTDVDTLVEALNYVVNNADTYNVKVITLSLASTTDWSAKTAPEEFTTAIEAVHDKGILVVYAAGNQYKDYNSAYTSFPCDFDTSAGAIGAIAVEPSSSSSDGFVRASYSNCNKNGSMTKDLSAPGGTSTGSMSDRIYSTEGDGYTYRSGTSMATPYVAGIAAMLFAADPTMTAAQVETALESNVTQLGATGWDDDTGYGLVNAEAALQATSTMGSSNPVMSGPETVGTSGGKAAFSVSNSETRTWTWTSSDESVATVAAGSSTSGATVTGGAKGTATIKATSDDYIELSQNIEVVDVTISGPGEIARFESGSLTVDGGCLPSDFTWSCYPEEGLTLSVGEDAVNVTGVSMGDYTVTATSKADTNYRITHSITVAPADMSAAIISGMSDQTYTGNAITLDNLQVTYGSGSSAVVLTEGTDYTVAYSNNVNAGTASIIVTGKGNYQGKKTVAFNIAPARLERLELSQTSFSYNGLACAPGSINVYGPKAGQAGRVLAAGTDYTLTTPNGRTMPGTYAYTATGKGNYTGTVSAAITVAQVPVESVTLSTSSYVYDGYQKSPTVTVKDANGRTMIAGTDYTLTTPSGRTNVGSYDYKVTPKGAYSGSPLTETMQITEASLVDAAVTLSPTTYAYDGAPKTPSATVKVNGRKLLKGTDYTLAYSNNANAGTATVIITGKGSYKGTKIVPFTILPGSSSASSTAQPAQQSTSTERNVRAQYNTHVQNVGWQAYVRDGATAGTNGKSLRLEGIHVSLLDHPYSGSIQYRTHIQNIGWQGWRSDGAMSGTSGQSLRLEAIQIRLTGQMAAHYDVYYRVHAQNVGWMSWAKNGESAGTAGYAYRLEAIQIKVVPKNSATPKASPANKYSAAFKAPQIQYRTHVQSDGWQGYMSDGAMSGTSGRSLRLEGINIKLGSDLGVSGSVQYRTHVQNIGWQGWRTDGAMSGTSGRSLRLEAIQIRLTGMAAAKYDVYYRVHAQNFGWMGWAKNGASAGTAGYAYRLEAIQIKIVPKNAAPPGSTANAFRQR